MSLGDYLQQYESGNDNVGLSAQNQIAEQNRMARAQEMEQDYLELTSGPLVETGAFSSLKKAYAQTNSLTENISIMARAATGMAGEIRWADEETGEIDFSYKSAEDMYGSGWETASYDERRAMIVDRDRQIIDNYYGNTMESGISATVGTIAGVMSDPTTLMPVGKTIGTAAGIGAGLGAAEATAQGMAVKGEVDAEDVFLAAAFGAGAGAAVSAISPMIEAGGRQFMGWLRSKFDAQVPVTPQEVKGQMDMFGMNAADRPDASTTAGEINDAMKNLLEKEKDVTKNPEQIDLFESRIQAAERKYYDAQAVTKAEQIEKAWAAKEGTVEFPSEFQITKDIDQSKKKLEKENIAFRYKTAPTANTAMADAMQKALKGKGEQLENFQKLGNKQQGGFADLNIMQNIASGGVGAAVGYAYDGEEGALFGALAGLGIAHTAPLAKKIYNRVDKMVKSFQPLTDQKVEEITKNFVSGKFLAKPETAFKTLGTAGMEFAERFKRANEDLNMVISKSLVDINKVFHAEGLKNKFLTVERTTEAYNQIPKLLRKTINEVDASPAAVAASREIRKVFQRTLNDAEEVGLISSQRKAELMARNQKEGYFPRVYNEFYLNSPSGQKRWIEEFTKRDWTRKELEDAFESLGGLTEYAEKTRKKVSGNQELTKAILDGRVVSKKGDVYKVSPSVAKKFHQKRLEAVASTRSNHLQKERKINLPDEVLEPFLVNDVETVLSSYLRDTYKAISLAKQFGNRDQVAQKLFSEVEKFSAPHAKEMQEVYYTMAGDLDWSENIRKFTEMPLWMKRAYGSAMSFETLKLLFAPVVNSVQATVNGSAMLSRVAQSSPQAMRAYTKGLKASMSKEGREWAKRTGATAESTLMQAMGDLSAGNHSIIHKEFKGIFSPLNVINQPSKFLKTIGFTDVENLQRILGANMGKALVEDVIETNSRLEARRLTHGLSKREEAMINKGRSTLAELGIDPNKDLKNISVYELERASQRFSNEINFINSPDQMPIALQNPMLKPFLQFKSFVIKHQAFLNKNVIRPLIKEGNPVPAITYISAGYLAGRGVDEVRRFIMGDDKDYTWTQKALRALTSVGGLGIMTEVAGNLAYDEGGLQKWLGGPMLSDLGSGGYAAIKSAMESDSKYLERFAVGLVPFPGRKKVQEALKEKSKDPYSYYKKLYKGSYSDYMEGY